MDLSREKDYSIKPLEESGPNGSSHETVEGYYHLVVSSWYLSRREIEDNSPSRRDGIDLKKEAYLRKSYCTFLQDLGMKLKVPQVTIATAIIYCHRFFLRQSHAKNESKTIATACMFLAGKVEETPRPLKETILTSYEIIHKKDPAKVQRIKQKEVYEQQKELILLGERVVLMTIDFDFNISHPYKPLVDAIKKFKVAQNTLAQVAWNFVNDGLRTSLCLQFKPYHIAAGAIFLAAKFLKVKLPSDGEMVWWQEFDVTPRQLEEVSNQMLELYEQNRSTQKEHNEGNSTGASNFRTPSKTHADADESTRQIGSSNMKQSNINMAPSYRSASDHSHTDALNGHRATQNERNNPKFKEANNSASDRDADDGRDRRHHGGLGIPTDALNGRTSHVPERHAEDFSMSEKVGKAEGKETDSGHSEGRKRYAPMVPIDKDKVRAALEKRRKTLANVPGKIVDVNVMDEDDLIERELENGVELTITDGRFKEEKKSSWSNPLYVHELENVKHGNYPSSEAAEEGEISFE